ncbi:hypothetical protein BHU72_14500 [Desulfuribacillus stibiiarsenatis]|uniref:Uncharacterized protein n=1 Tax=Desulfuribacillus stibiiarsenatis TaxID=1390249 RepID=A0A1E5L7S8_9FIRM|nr:hypothetical protein BHU72_14500 [Desulfuribacillus stibiiarsenatis]
MSVWSVGADLSLWNEERVRQTRIEQHTEQHERVTNDLRGRVAEQEDGRGGAEGKRSTKGERQSTEGERTNW